MRPGVVYTVNQTLTTEAASVLKHSLSLARRRGHAHITPLHVAAVLLSGPTSSTPLRRACLKSQNPNQSHSFPLQSSRALELCLNVALNRLPTNPNPNPSPIGILHGHYPSLSNALTAALKRAQAHQRRGFIEQNQQQQQQQQPLLAIKVELEQLILSILDDPSVSRVMREAGFSSVAVKNHLLDFSSSSSSSVFQSYRASGGVYSSPCSPENPNQVLKNPSSLWYTHFLNPNSETNPVQLKRIPSNPFADSASLSSSVRELGDGIKLVLGVLLRKKKKA